jgi:hypothetical protein
MDVVGGYATSGKVSARGCRPGGERVTLCFRREQQDKAAVEPMAVCRCVRYAEHRRGWRRRRRKARGRAHSERARVARRCVSALSTVVVVSEYLLAPGQMVPENNAAYGVAAHACCVVFGRAEHYLALRQAYRRLNPPRSQEGYLIEVNATGSPAAGAV